MVVEPKKKDGAWVKIFDGVLVANMYTEEDYFRALGIKYLAPEERNIN